ncbi:FmtB-protein [Staphylococcus aureus]|nr:FmtB-protein [Staphylococcus aureus]
MQSIKSAVQPHVTKKQTATGVLTDLATAKKQEINQNTNATTEEKQVALNQVDQDLATAINNINQADTNRSRSSTTIRYKSN